MKVKTGYLPREDLWAMSVWEGTTLLHVSPDRYALECNAKKAGLAWILDANKLIDTVNDKEQSQ
jgi:hypothetical protein